jgi:hypothetical protein
MLFHVILVAKENESAGYSIFNFGSKLCFRVGCRLWFCFSCHCASLSVAFSAARSERNRSHFVFRLRERQAAASLKMTAEVNFAYTQPEQSGKGDFNCFL